MKLYVYYTSPADNMAFDAIRGMALIHDINHVEFCSNPEECDRSLFLISSASDIKKIRETQNKLNLLKKPFFTFWIHGDREKMPNLPELNIAVWDEGAILNILKN
ncbi:MAG: hypothetical protein R3D71_02925 [Rickettsiales bacterium]